MLLQAFTPMRYILSFIYKGGETEAHIAEAGSCRPGPDHSTPAHGSLAPEAVRATGAAGTAGSGASPGEDRGQGGAWGTA